MAKSTTTSPIPAFGYLRVSGRDQEDGDGFPRQRAAIERFAASSGMHVVRWFEERAIPGKTEWDARPAWSEMCVSFNGVRTILIEKLDRLARDLMVQEHIISDLRKRKVDLVSAHEPDLCVEDPTRNLMRQIMGAISEYDRCMIVMKLKAARERQKASTGRCEGRIPYGGKDKNGIIRNGEPETLARILRMAVEGRNPTEISRELNMEGVMPRTGVAWYPAGIDRLLRASRVKGVR